MVVLAQIVGDGNLSPRFSALVPGAQQMVPVVDRVRRVL